MTITTCSRFVAFYNAHINMDVDPWRVRTMFMPAVRGFARFGDQSEERARYATFSRIMRHFMLRPFTARVDGREQRIVVVQWNFPTQQPDQRWPRSLPHLENVLDAHTDIEFAGSAAT